MRALLRSLPIYMMNLLIPAETERVASSLMSHAGRGLILEVGGGVGRKTASMVRESQVVNVDVSFAASGRMPRGGGGSEEKVLASAVYLPFKESCFDSATLFEVLEHITRDFEVGLEVRRTLKNSGLIYITSPSDKWRFPHLKYPFHKYLFPSEEDLGSGFGHVRRGYSIEQISALFPRCTVVIGGYYMSFLGGLLYDLRFSRFGRVALLIFPLLLVLKSLYYFSESSGQGFGTCVTATLRRTD